MAGLDSLESGSCPGAGYRQALGTRAPRPFALTAGRRSPGSVEQGVQLVQAAPALRIHQEVRSDSASARVRMLAMKLLRHGPSFWNWVNVQSG